DDFTQVLRRKPHPADVAGHLALEDPRLHHRLRASVLPAPVCGATAIPGVAVFPALSAHRAEQVMAAVAADRDARERVWFFAERPGGSVVMVPLLDLRLHGREQRHIDDRR